MKFQIIHKNFIIYTKQKSSSENSLISEKLMSLTVIRKLKWSRCMLKVESTTNHAGWNDDICGGVSRTNSDEYYSIVNHLCLQNWKSVLRMGMVLNLGDFCKSILDGYLMGDIVSTNSLQLRIGKSLHARFILSSFHLVMFWLSCLKKYKMHLFYSPPPFFPHWHLLWKVFSGHCIWLPSQRHGQSQSFLHQWWERSCFAQVAVEQPGENRAISIQ